MTRLTRLRFERTRRNISQRNLGSTCNIKQPIISWIELGKWNPTPDQLHALARALAISPPESLLQEIVVAEMAVTR